MAGLMEGRLDVSYNYVNGMICRFVRSMDDEVPGRMEE